MRKSCLLVLLLGTVLCTSIQGAERTWDGSVSRDDDWTTAANWVGSVAPVAGDSLRFPPGAGQLSNSNDYAPGTIFDAITYSGAGYTAHGNRVALSNGVSLTYASGLTVMHPPITLRQDQTFTVSQPGATLFLYGDIGMGNNGLDFTGGGNVTILGDIDNDRLGFRSTVRKSGAGQLLILQHARYNCPTLINGGTLRVDYSLSNSTVTVNSGGTLLGLGKVEGLRANAGAIVRPGGATPFTFDVLRDAELNAGSIFRVRLNGTNAGSNYDQLRVGGPITLGGTLEVIPGYIPVPGHEFTIIKNDGTNDIAGTFAGLAEGAEFAVNGRPYKISYGGRAGGGLGGPFGRNDDVTIEAIPARAIWDAGGGFNNLWSQALNWVGDVIPFPGDDIQFSNTLFSTMVTTNDFVGRLFGSLILQGGDQRIIGNGLQLDGRIDVTGMGERDYDVNVPVSLRGGILHDGYNSLSLRAAISLVANQTFDIRYDGFAHLICYDGIALNGHTLRVDSLPVWDYYAPQFRGPVLGPGVLIKTGPGTLAVSNTVSCPVTVEEGTLIAGGAAALTDVTVEAGGVLRANGLNLNNLEVQAGGTFAPIGYRSPVVGSVRLLSGSTFSVDIFVVEGSQIDQTYSTGIDVTNKNGRLEITGCNLSVNVDPNAEYAGVIIAAAPEDDEVIGTFAGLPEGALFSAGDRVFGITYRGGNDGNQVILYPVTTFVWDGGGPDFAWSTGANWNPDFTPPPLSLLIFPAGVSKRSVVNDLPASTRFSGLRFEGPGYNISGNSFRLDSLGCNFDGDAVIDAELSIFSSNPNSGIIDIVNTATLHLQGRLSTIDARKRGAGVLRLGNATGDLFVEAGRVDLLKTGVYAFSGTLDIEGGIVRLLDDDQLSDSAAVFVRAAGQLDLNGKTDTIGGLLGDGTVDFSERGLRSGRLSVKQGAFAGRFTGGGIFTKTSALAFVVTGVNPFPGTTVLEQGELRMDGVQTNGTIRLDGGLLTGRGYVGAVTGNSGGTVAPGFGGPQYDSALHTRNVTFNSTTTFRTVLTSSSPDFEGHKLQVAGTVNLGNSALVIDIYSNFQPTNGATWIIIENDGNDPIIGTFAGLPEGATVTGEGFLFRISYVGGTGNDVTLTRVSAPPSTISRINRLPDGRFRVQGQGVSGLKYQLQSTLSLNPVIQWSPAGAATAGVNGIFQMDYFYGPQPPPQRFYRAISP